MAACGGGTHLIGPWSLWRWTSYPNTRHQADHNFTLPVFPRYHLLINSKEIRTVGWTVRRRHCNNLTFWNVWGISFRVIYVQYNVVDSMFGYELIFHLFDITDPLNHPGLRSGRIRRLLDTGLCVVNLYVFFVQCANTSRQAISVGECVAILSKSSISIATF